MAATAGPAAQGERKLLIRGGMVLLDSNREPRRADVLVHDGAIVRVGRDLEHERGTEVLDASDHLVMPGLVNAHTHTHNSLARGAIDGLPLELWLLELGARIANRSPRELYVAAAIGAIEMAKTGTTCACDMAAVLPWPTDEALDAIIQAYRDVGLRVSFAPQIADRPFIDSFPGLRDLLPTSIRAQLADAPPYPTAEVLATIRSAIDRWHGTDNGRVRVGIAVSIVTLCTADLLDGCREIVDRQGVTFQTHLSETKATAGAARMIYGSSPTAKLQEVGLLGPNTLLAHCVWLEDDELEMVAEARSSIAHNPISNLKLGAGIAPLRKMLDRGCNVALGTDGSASSDNQNLFGVLREAAILHRVVNSDHATWPSAGEVVEMATSNGARAAGFSDVGSIAPGKRADLALLDLGATYFHPRNDLVAQLVHAEVGSSVRTVLVDGRVIVRDGRMTTVDEGALLAEANEIGRRVSREVRGALASARRLQPYVRQAATEAAAW